MKVHVICAAGLLLAGCSSILEYSTEPTPARVASYVTEIATATQPVPGMTPLAYLYGGIAYTNRACDVFFDNLTRLRDNSRLIDTVISTAIASGSSLMAAFNAGKVKEAAVVAASLASVNLVNQSVREIYFFTKYAGSLRAQVRDQMRKYLSDESDGLAGIIAELKSNRIDSPERWIIARAGAEAYAQLCSITNIHQIVETAIGATPMETSLPIPPVGISSNRFAPARNTRLLGLVPNNRVGQY